MELLQALDSTAEVSLWTCLHDGELQAIFSDLRTQTVTVTVHVPHIGGNYGIPEDVRFLITIGGVRVTLAGRYCRPFAFERSPGVTREEECRLIDEYRRRWRSESMAWTEFELALSDNPMDISNASLFTKEGVVILTAVGNLHGDQYDDVCCEFYLLGSSIEAARSDGQPFSVTDLIRYGERYWEDWSRRAEASRRARLSE